MTQEALKLALEALKDLLDQTEPPPDKNCSCHIAPPCSDCVDYSGVRYAIEQANKTITAIKEALAKEKALQALHSENERLGLYKEAYAQRTWVGLTDDEIDEWTPEIHAVIKAIEAKLKEKNT